ncbi:MAG: hypothetical protein Rubg2KO_06430 [Rubricoccaceae bacterium]
MRHFSLLALPFLLLSACDTTGDDSNDPGPYVVVGTFDIDPTGTYLRTSQDPANGPTVIKLDSLGVVAGDSLYVRILGEMDLDPGAGTNGQPGALSFSMIGVFSSSDTVLESDVLERVPGAINVPGVIESGTTGVGELPTDIPEDVVMNRGQFLVPAGATTLLMSPNDRFFSDNTTTGITATLSIKKNV